MIRKSTVSLLVTLSLISISTYAAPSPIAYPPHIIKPNTPSFLPSGFSPAQISNAYGINFVPFNGEGQIIGIVDAYDDASIESDLGAFDTQFNLPSCTTANGCFTKIYATGTQPSADANWAVETALDVEWAHAIAPNAKIILVEAADASLNALFTGINVAVAHGATTISLSWGSSEFSGETTFDTTLRNYVVNNGVTFFVASGDYGHGVMYPSASTYVIAVGGTTLTTDAAGNYISETAWSGSGGGLSIYEGETGPQKTLPIPNDTVLKRGVPDVSLNADPNTGYSVYDTGSSGWIVVGGTSAAAPEWAGLLALAKSGSHKKLTSVYTALYNAAKGNYKVFFNDILTGTNGSCGYYCAARAGYDYVTGIGTPQAYYLVNQLIYTAERGPTV